MSDESDALQGNLAVLSFQSALVDYLTKEEPEIWKWYADQENDQALAESVKLDLLKRTYRIEENDQPELYKAAREVSQALNIEAPIQFFQSQDVDVLNAGLCFVPGELHVVFTGDVLEILEPNELKALLGHEFGHYLLAHGWERQYFNANEVMAMLVNDSQSERVHYETYRINQLYTEVFCDRAALHVVKDLHTVVKMLVTMATGSQSLSADSYINQAAELFSKTGLLTSEGITHPEHFIRTQALVIWTEDGPAGESKIDTMLCGKPSIEKMDMIRQRELYHFTRQFIQLFLAESWMQTEPILAHARMFYDDFKLENEATTTEKIEAFLREAADDMKMYFVYLMLDFVAADRELDVAPVAYTLEFVRKIGLLDELREVMPKELKMTKTQFEKIDQQREALLEKVRKQVESNDD